MQTPAKLAPAKEVGGGRRKKPREGRTSPHLDKVHKVSPEAIPIEE